MIKLQGIFERQRLTKGEETGAPKPHGLTVHVTHALILELNKGAIGTVIDKFEALATPLERCVPARRIGTRHYQIAPPIQANRKAASRRGAGFLLSSKNPPRPRNLIRPRDPARLNKLAEIVSRQTIDAAETRRRQQEILLPARTATARG